MKDLISVIIPVYNVSDYLDKCLESIVNQTYRNLEIIIIDDGSTDNSGIICDNWAKMDTRIKVYHQENKGLSSARNLGIKKSNGKYLNFVDSDDFVDLDIIEFLYDSLINNKCDISTCMLKECLNTNDYHEEKENNVFICNNELALEKLLYQQDCSVSACAKLYKRELFKDILYPEGIIYEDLATTYLLFAKARKVVINTTKKYYYVKRNNSIMNSHFDIRKMVSLEIIKEETEFIKKNFPNLIKASLNKEFQIAMYVLCAIPLKKEYRKYYNDLKNVIIKTRKIVLFDKNSHLKHRVYAFFSYFGIKGLVIIHKIYVYLKL